MARYLRECVIILYVWYWITQKWPSNNYQYQEFNIMLNYDHRSYVLRKRLQFLLYVKKSKIAKLKLFLKNFIFKFDWYIH